MRLEDDIKKRRELEARIKKNIAKKGELDRKIAQHAASSKLGNFITTLRVGWNSYSFLFYIGGISALLGEAFGWAGWTSIIFTVLFFYCIGKFEQNVNKEREKRKKQLK